MNLRTEANFIARRLSTMEKTDDIEKFGPEILRLLDGVSYATWDFLDKNPGKFDFMSDRFYMLRRVRNHPDWRKRLFDGLRDKP